MENYRGITQHPGLILDMTKNVPGASPLAVMWALGLRQIFFVIESVRISEIPLQKPIMSRSHGLRRVYFLSILSPRWVQATLSQLQL